MEGKKDVLQVNDYLESLLSVILDLMKENLCLLFF